MKETQNQQDHNYSTTTPSPQQRPPKNERQTPKKGKMEKNTTTDREKEEEGQHRPGNIPQKHLPTKTEPTAQAQKLNVTKPERALHSPPPTITNKSKKHPIK